MISGSFAGPNTIRARTTISRTSNGPRPKTFIRSAPPAIMPAEAGQRRLVCRPQGARLDHEPLSAGKKFFGEREVQLGGGNPYLPLARRLGLGAALQDVSTALR